MLSSSSILRCVVVFRYHKICSPLTVVSRSMLAKVSELLQFPDTALQSLCYTVFIISLVFIAMVQQTFHQFYDVELRFTFWKIWSIFCSKAFQHILMGSCPDDPDQVRPDSSCCKMFMCLVQWQSGNSMFSVQHIFLDPPCPLFAHSLSPLHPLQISSKMLWLHLCRKLIGAPLQSYSDKWLCISDQWINPYVSRTTCWSTVVVVCFFIASVMGKIFHHMQKPRSCCFFTQRSKMIKSIAYCQGVHTLRRLQPSIVLSTVLLMQRA